MSCSDMFPLVARALAFSALAFVTGCASSTVAPPGQAPAPAAATAEWTAVDSIMRASFPADGPGATAIVVRDGNVVYRGAAGMANLELGVPMRPDMVLPVFSVAKQFTGVAILMLAEEGKLALADPLTRFFPDYPVKGRTVTVAHLLGHTSGLPNYSDHPEWPSMLRSHVTKEDLIALFRNEPFSFEPGERWEYNNSAYVLLGAIIEQLSGMSHGDFLRTRIFKPLGMTSTYVYDTPEAVIPRRVPGYTRTPDGWTRAEYFSLTHGYGGGNLLSSVDDLARWDAAIARGEILSPQSWGRAFTSFTLNDGSSTRYAAGWFLRRMGVLETAEHAGNLMGGIASVLRVPQERLFVAILANADPAPADPERLSLEIGAHVLGVSPEPPRISLTPSQLDEYVGTYRISETNTRTISRENDRLYSQRAGGERFEIYPIGKDEFYFPASGMSVRFERENGRVIAHVLIPRQDAPGAPARRVD